MIAMTRMLKKTLKGILSRSEADEFVSAFDQIGEIIVVRIPDSLLAKRYEIGRALLDEVKIARSVFCQTSAVQGEYRTRRLQVIAGVDDTITEYRESGCRFVVDVENAFFSPRLSHERERIANLVSDGQIILNMFGGVGAFSIVAAMQKKCTVYNIDSNPVAAKLCEQNIALNEYSRKKKKRKMAGIVHSICGETAQVIRDGFGSGGDNDKTDSVSDRTLMLLPERSDEFLDSAIRATKSGGVIHYYSHVHADSKKDAPGLSAKHYLDAVSDVYKNVLHTDVLDFRIVRAVGPRYYQTVVDARIFKDD